MTEVQKLCSDMARNNVFYYPESKTIYDAIALLSLANWVVSVDTAVVHIASGLNKPLLALYLRNEFSEWHPNSEYAITCFPEQVSSPDINVLSWKNLLPSLSKLLKS